MTLELYNTLTKRREDFTPLDPAGRRVLFYSCGPTVYDYAHIGNFRSFLNADVLRRTLELFGYEVRHVMNITDVGHMTDDEVADGAGQDKMAAARTRLREQKQSGKLPAGADTLDPDDPFAVANFYADAFIADARMLGMKVAIEAESEPGLLPRPSQYIEQMIALIGRLIAGGNAYVAGDGVVYFNVQSFADYGRLSGNTLDKLRSGAGGRVDESTQAVKHHPADFMLWKPDPTHLMRWPSPWGEGYPGWHLECSVMAATLLGEEIDIHSGGEDNIFPHHECEIAQTCADSGHAHFARYWFHTRHLIADGAKMSKSLGNFHTVRDLVARGGSPAAIRLALTQTHYRSNANFTFLELQNAQRRIERWMNAREKLHAQRAGASPPPESPTPGLSRPPDAFTSALANDLNISAAIAAIDEHLDQIDDPNVLDAMLDTLGLLHLEWKAEGGAVSAESASLGLEMPAMPTDAAGVTPEWIESMLQNRARLRAEKDFAAADNVRDDLLSFGIEINDGPTATTWSRVVG